MNNTKKMDSIYNKKFTNIQKKNSPEKTEKRGRPTSTENFRSKLKLILIIYF